MLPKMKIIYLFSMIISLLLCRAERKADSDLVPTKIIAQFPRYHFLGLSDLDSMAADDFKEAFPKEEPGLVKTDLVEDADNEISL